VIGIDLKKTRYSQTRADKFFLADLRNDRQATKYIVAADELYMLAADMGGVGYINTMRAEIIHNNASINLNSIRAAHHSGIDKVFFASTACVYPEFKQETSDTIALKEDDALPAQPDTPYGWEKLFTEQVLRSYALDHGLKVRIARLHNIYGPESTFQGGREKAPAALCRKVALASDGESIEIWGDGQQTRSYCHIDDCCQGIFKIMQSNYDQPLNLGSSELISVNDLVDLIAEVAGKKVVKKHNLNKPQGVRGRNSDNTRLKESLGWSPTTTLKQGITPTYYWIANQVR